MTHDDTPPPPPALDQLLRAAARQVRVDDHARQLRGEPPLSALDAAAWVVLARDRVGAGLRVRDWQQVAEGYLLLVRLAWCQARPPVVTGPDAPREPQA
jgi:hypothetical protein